ncbi:hypothetical protein [Halobacillus halophilus]|uniref:hypothetical protein n=1 Tax=Halobacillus halophilus TaxID=1570 RepID=UPI001CD7D462|nr:hypothetical protein [Halobacillus halophilus]MCA1012824.1 hypothetical protein [Halobacillus halophilus]
MQILQALLPLIGVIIGGFVSYLAQTANQKRIEKNKDRRQKTIAYNEILKREGENSPLEPPIHSGENKEFDWKNYVEGNRRILYDNLHLFDFNIADKVLHIDYLGEKAEALGPEQEDIDWVYNLYFEIIDWIKKDYPKSK